MINMLISLSIFAVLAILLLGRRELRKRSGIQVHSLKQVGTMLFIGALVALALGFALSYR